MQAEVGRSLDEKDSSCSHMSPGLLRHHRPPHQARVRVRDAHRVFDRMSTGSQDEQTIASMEDADGEDRISALPNEVIHHVLGFLPAQEAVRTSLLARGWRHHWKSMRSLRITAVGGGPVLSAEWLNSFMARLLRELRAPLDVFDVYIEVFQCDDVCQLESYRWVLQAVSEHHARVVMVDIELVAEEPSFGLARKPFVSRHLARLELCYVILEGRILDFSRCPALEDLVMVTCDIGAKRVQSPSLKRLRIAYCDFCVTGSRTRISAPRLVWLKVEHLMGTSPVLERMPLLETAIVRLDCNHHYNNDYPCVNGDNGDCCGLCEGCVGNDEHCGGCFLLQGLSSATHLELTVPFAKFTDTTCYPAFTKLKTLLLDEWCVAADFRALICILQHSPNLEKLTIGFNKVLKNRTELEGNDHPAEQLSSISENLKIVKIKCFGVDERVSKISKLFHAFDIQVCIE